MAQVLWSLSMMLAMFLGMVIFLAPLLLGLLYFKIKIPDSTYMITPETDRIERNMWIIIVGGYAIMLFSWLMLIAPR